MALEAPRPYRSKRRFDPPPASKPGLRKTTRAPTNRTATPSSPSRPVENARPGWRAFRSAAFAEGIRFDYEMRRTFRRTTHFSKNEYPSFTSPTGPGGFRPRGPRMSRFMALHSLRIARIRGGGGMLLRLRARTGFPLTLLFGSLPAGPHERCRRSTTRSAFHRWVGARRHRSTGFCNRREGRAHPGATRYPAA
jgi:hypothetical protein